MLDSNIWRMTATMLKIRKCQWIGRPGKVRVLSSSSLSFPVTGVHRLVWTAGVEDDDIVFDRQGDCRYEVGVILAPGAGVSLCEEDGGLVYSLHILDVETRSFFPGLDTQGLVVSRRADTVSFIKDGIVLASLSYPTIAASVSVYFCAHGGSEALFRFSQG